MGFKTSLSFLYLSLLGSKSVAYGRLRNSPSSHRINNDVIEDGLAPAEASFASIGREQKRRNNRRRRTATTTITNDSPNTKTDPVKKILDQERRRLINSIDGEEETRLVVQYADEFAHKRVVKQATHVYQDLDTDDEVIMICDVRCIEELMNDNGIIDVSVDHLVVEYGHVPEGAPRRTLQEVMPVGLKMIQADQLPAGPDEVVVCIADTGLAIGHPDFNTDFITGTHTYKDNGVVWRWDEDWSKFIFFKCHLKKPTQIFFSYCSFFV